MPNSFQSYPCFLALEAASFDANSKPTAIAWSLPDGTIKQALIEPEDAWDMPSGAHTAFSCSEIVKEFLFDQEDEIFYAASLEPYESWLLQVFAAAGEEVTFELAAASSLSSNPNTWHDAVQDTLAVQGLSFDLAEDLVKAMLLTYAEISDS